MSKAVNKWNGTNECSDQIYVGEGRNSSSDDNLNEEEEDSFEVTEEEKESLCRAFTLLDVNGDGVIRLSEIKKLLISLGRLPFDENLSEILSYATEESCDDSNGIDYNGFENYVTEQLRNVKNEEELRRAFQIFDTNTLTGRVNVKELRHALKTVGNALTDDEIDFLYREEDYWMLDDRDCIEYEKLIDKLMGRESDCKFLNF